MRSLWLPLLLGLALPLGAQEGRSPRQAGEALRARLGQAGVDAARTERRRLGVYLGDVQVGSLILTTRVAERDDGQTVYRVMDTLRVDMPGIGSLHMNVEADLRADLSPVEVVLNTEEPRGVGVISWQRVTLRRDAEGWLREVVKGQATPVIERLPELDDAALVLTPPLGAGERLARWAEPVLGQRLSTAGYDLETGGRASWRLSFDEHHEVALADGVVAAVLTVRQEGAAELEGALAREGGDLLWLRLGARLRAVQADVLRDGPPLDTPAGVVARALRAVGRRDVEALRELLDLAALGAEAGGEDPAAEGEALLRLIESERWDQGRGLALQATRAADLTSRAVEGGFAVSPQGAPERVYRVAPDADGRLRVVGLPR